MDRYHDIKMRLLELAANDASLRAIIAIGSSVRDYSHADQYSDLDLIIATEQPDAWLYGDTPKALGEIRISFVEPTLGGGMERRILYSGNLDVDFIIFTPEQLLAAIESGAAAEVMCRGYAVLFDGMDITERLGDNIVVSVPRHAMTEHEFCNRVNDFFFHCVWASKKIMRGELWTAKMCIDAYLKRLLLGIIELHADHRTDVWHDGRFLDRWADSDVTDALAGCFAHYERSDMVSALRRTMLLFCRLAREAAHSHCFNYPDDAERYALSLIDEYFGSEQH